MGKQHDALFAAKLAGSSGGGGEASDYTDLTNKPQINGVILSGNKTGADLGLVPAENGKGLSTEDYTTAEKSKLAGLSNYDDTQVRADISSLNTGKADKSNTYTKNDIDFMLTKKQGTLTSAQLAAVNSGITADKVGQYDNIYIVMNHNALNHNGIFRGKDLTNIYTIDEMYDMNHAGTFDDLFLGDYFTKSITTDIYTHFTGAEFEIGTEYYEMGGGTDVTARTWTLTEDSEPQSGKVYATKQTRTEIVTLMYAGFNCYYNTGDTALTTPHAILILKEGGFATSAKMNPTNATAGGYYGSDMHQITLPSYAKSLKIMLKNHLLSHRTWLTTTVNPTTPSMAGAGMTGAASVSAWETTELQLMNEVQLYGSAVWSSGAYDVGVDNEKLPVFNFINPVQYGRSAFWLRSVVSSTNFALCNTYGSANYNAASNAYGVRPLILFG